MSELFGYIRLVVWLALLLLTPLVAATFVLVAIRSDLNIKLRLASSVAAIAVGCIALIFYGMLLQFETMTRWGLAPFMFVIEPVMDTMKRIFGDLAPFAFLGFIFVVLPLVANFANFLVGKFSSSEK